MKLWIYKLNLLLLGNSSVQKSWFNENEQKHLWFKFNWNLQKLRRLNEVVMVYLTLLSDEEKVFYKLWFLINYSKISNFWVSLFPNSFLVFRILCLKLYFSNQECFINPRQFDFYFISIQFKSKMYLLIFSVSKIWMLLFPRRCRSDFYIHHFVVYTCYPN